MQMLEQYFSKLLDEAIYKLIISKPQSKKEPYRKIVIEKKSDYYQLAKYTEKQVFHENISASALTMRCLELTDGHYAQVNAWSDEWEYYILISKKGNPTLKRTKIKQKQTVSVDTHNRRKNYILEEGTPIPPLVDMGVFTKEGKVVRTMYDKFRQINRFIEMIDDTLKDSSFTELNVIDFGCGKSYLTLFYIII